jgi:hypothetical protein
MSNFDIFTHMQIKILNMNNAELIVLLNDCLSTIDKIQKTQPSSMREINNILNKNACILDNNSIELLSNILHYYNIGNDNFLIENIQTGGGKDDNQIAVQTETVDDSSNTIVSNTSNNNPSILPINDLAGLMMASKTAGLSNEQISKILEQYLILQQQKEKTDQESLILQQEKEKTEQTKLNTHFALQQLSYKQKDDQQLRRELAVGNVITLASSGALTYYMCTAGNTLSNYVLKVATELGTKALSTAELTVRNAMPATVNAIVGGLSYVGASSTLTNFFSPYTEYAEDSVAAREFRTLTAVSEELSQNGIIIGGVLVFLSMSIILKLLLTGVIRVTNIRNRLNISGNIGIARIEYTGTSGGKRKTKKSKKRNKRNRRLTRRR